LTLEIYHNELFSWEVDMNDSSFTHGELLQRYDDQVHFYDLIVNWVNELHSHFLASMGHMWLVYALEHLKVFLKETS
jgi:hypothetical protein